jgi:multiple antibiotic resistance protein
MTHFVQTVLLAVGALLPIVDPLGGAPIYQRLTAGVDPADRAPLAKRVALDSFVLLLASTLIGTYVLEFFALSIPAVQLAGGIVVCAIAWPLLTGPDTPEALSRTKAAEAAATEWRPRAFYPLTLPLTVGPGSISVALALGANRAGGVRWWLFTALAHALGILIVAAAVYVCYRYADVILRKLGATGAAVLMRLSAFILLCIGVQIAWNGIDALLSSTFRLPPPGT